MSIKREIPSNNFITFTKYKVKYEISTWTKVGSLNLKLSSYAWSYVKLRTKYYTLNFKSRFSQNCLERT